MGAGDTKRPRGRPPQEPAFTVLKQMTYSEFLSRMQKYGRMNRAELNEAVKDPTLPMFDIVVANIVASAAKGEKDARTVLLERLWGKVKEQVAFTNETPHDELLDRVPDDKIVAILRSVK